MKNVVFPDLYSDPLEEVADQVSYLGESRLLERHIYQAVLKLPLPVRRFVFTRCTFASGDYGICLPMREATHRYRQPGKRGAATKRWLIVLKARLPSRHALGIVAHEVAHAYLGHDRCAIDSQETWETDAADLTRKWGFTGIGSDPAYCNAPFRLKSVTRTKRAGRRK